MALNFAAFAYLPLADATAIQFVAPIALTMLSVPLLDERVGPWRWSAVLIGFVGVVIMTSPTAPDNDSAYVGMALGLCAAILAALADLRARDGSGEQILTYTVRFDARLAKSFRK